MRKRTAAWSKLAGFIGTLLLCCTSAHGQSINVLNGSFEDATLPLNIGLGPYSNILPGSPVATGGTLPNWTPGGTTSNGAAGAYAPTIFVPWWVGKDVAYIYVYAPGNIGMAQFLTATLQNNTNYTLSALIGRVPTYLFSYAIQLWAGSTVLASSSKLEGDPNFVSGADTLTYFSGGNNPQAGQQLSIVIGAVGSSQGYTGAFFDNISLTAVPNAATAISTLISAGSFGGFSSASPGSWVEIYGANLATNTRPWAGTDFNGINAPTSLDGTKVTIGGKSAFVDYISPGQVNALLPSDTPTGSQQLTVTSPAGTTAAYSININPVEPGLLAPANFKVSNTQYAVATFSDGAYALPVGAIPGVNSRPAKPGDALTIYGVGFGAVTPSVSAGQLVQQLNTLSMPLVMSVGAMAANLVYDGLAPSFTGLYQFNLTVPQLPAGDAPLTFTLNGTPGAQTLYIPIGN